MSGWRRRVSVSRSEHGVLVCVGGSGKFGETEVGACRRPLDLEDFVSGGDSLVGPLVCVSSEGISLSFSSS